jgi:DinB superfamily
VPEPRRLRPPEVGRLLDSVVAIIRAELGTLPDEILAWHPAPREWCAKEIVGHLIESERRGFAGRIRIILASDGAPTLETWDQDEIARARRDCGRDATALIDEFAGLRRDSVGLVAGLGDADLERGGHHPKVGFLPVGDLLHEWVHHDRNHVRQLLANIQALTWPSMGNARRFSTG